MTRPVARDLRRLLLLSNVRKWAPFRRYRSRDLCLAYKSALAVGDPDAEIRL